MCRPTSADDTFVADLVATHIAIGSLLERDGLAPVMGNRDLSTHGHTHTQRERPRRRKLNNIMHHQSTTQHIHNQTPASDVTSTHIPLPPHPSLRHLLIYPFPGSEVSGIGYIDETSASCNIQCRPRVLQQLELLACK